MLFIGVFSAVGQNFQWAKGMGGPGFAFNSANGISVDASGNVYTAGSFENTTDFDPGVGVFNITPLNGSDIFVSKLDASGNFVWAKSMGGTTNERAIGISVDASGNVYTTGFFDGTVDFDPGAGVFNLTSVGDYSIDIFVSKLDSSGNFVWARSMGGTSYDQASGISVDASGNVYTTGFFRDTVDFDPGVGVYNLIAVLDDIFVSKLDASGDFVWAKSMGGTRDEQANGISVDASGNVYTTGFFEGTADFDPGVGISNLTSAGNNDIFVSKLDASGNFVWAKRMGTSGFGGDQATGISVDASGNVYTTGGFHGTVDFNPGVGVSNLTSAGVQDIFVSKLNASGNFVWARRTGGIGYDQATGISVDASENVFTTGSFAGTADFDPGVGVFNLTAAGSADIFVSKLDASGNFVWASRMGGISGEQATGISVDASGNVYTTGFFEGTADFDSGVGVFNLTATDGSEIFVSKLFDCNGTLVAPTFTAVAAICSGASLSDLPETSNNGISGTWSPELNNMATTEYTFTPTAGLCATTATMTIVVNSPINVTSATISSSNTNSSYAKIGDVITLSFTTSETLANAPSVLFNGNAVTVTGSDNSWSAIKTVDSNDSNGIMSFSISFQDPNNCSENHTTVTDGSSVTIDTSAPTVTSSSISSSNNVNPSIATPGDMVSLSFTASESLTITPIVTINGSPASVSGSGTSWSASRTVAGSDSNGVVSFNISISDAAGNSTSITSTTDSSSVTIDTCVPIIPTFTAVASICSGVTLDALPETSNNGIEGIWSPAIDNTVTTEYTFIPTAGLCATTATMTITVTPNVTPTFTAVAAICAGGSLSDLPETSNNGIEGTWSPALNNSLTTEYTFTPAVGECASTATMTITVTPNVTPTFTSVAAICSGGSLSDLPEISNNGISGTWSPALNNSLTTEYTFTPAVGECASTATMTITVTPNVTPTFTSVAAICSGGSLSDLPEISNNGISGTWSPALNNSLTTEYTFTPTAGLCATTTTLTITVNPNVMPTFTTVAAICSGVTLDALPLNSNNGITGTWSPALNNMATTEYTFTPAVGECASTATMTIVVNQCFCIGARVANLLPSGTNITWYDSEAATTALNSRAVLTTKKYYYTETIGGIVGSKNEENVIVNPTSVSGSITGATGRICYNSGKTLSLATTARGAVQWQSSATASGVYTSIVGATARAFNAANLTASTYYKAVVTSGVCPSKTTAPVKVTVLPQSVAGTISGGTSVCSGTNSTLLVLGAKLGTIQWQSSTDAINFSPTSIGTSRSLSVSNLNTTTYYRTVVTNGIGCTPAISPSVAIIVKPIPNPGIISGTSMISYNTRATLAVTGYDAGATFLWQYSGNVAGIYKNGGQPIITEDTYTTAQLTRDFYFKVVVTKDGCSSSSAPFFINVGTRGKFSDSAAQSVDAPFDVIAYPNPSSTEFTIETSSKGATIRVYDVVGRLIENRQTTSNSVQVGKNYATGVYNVIVNQGTKVKTLRVIKK